MDHRQEKYKPPDPAPKRVGDGTGELQSSKRVAGQTTKVTKPQVIQEDKRDRTGSSDSSIYSICVICKPKFFENSY